jgi:hypothetical protein
MIPHITRRDYLAHTAAASSSRLSSIALKNAPNPVMLMGVLFVFGRTNERKGRR